MEGQLCSASDHRLLCAAEYVKKTSAFLEIPEGQIEELWQELAELDEPLDLKVAVEGKGTLVDVRLQLKGDVYQLSSSLLVRALEAVLGSVIALYQAPGGQVTARVETADAEALVARFLGGQQGKPARRAAEPAYEVRGRPSVLERQQPADADAANHGVQAAPAPKAEAASPPQLITEPAAGVGAQAAVLAERRDAHGGDMQPPAAEQVDAAATAPAVAGRKRGRQPLTAKQPRQTVQSEQRGPSGEGQPHQHVGCSAGEGQQEQCAAQGPEAGGGEGEAAAGAAGAAARDATTPCNQRWQGSEEDDEAAFFEEQRAVDQLRRRKVTGNCEVRHACAPPQAPAATAAAAVAAAQTAVCKRARRPSVKAEENTETDVLLAQAAQLGREAVRSGWRVGKRGMRGMDDKDSFKAPGFKRSAHQPIALLPGEAPLGVELFFGEGRPLLPNRRAGLSPPEACGEGKDLPVSERYEAAVRRARSRLSNRMRGQGASEADVSSMLRLLRDFEAKCLAGSEPTSPEESKQICRELRRRLRQVYNRHGEAPLVLDPHVVSAAALVEQEGADDIQLMRVIERRFIIWTPPDLPARQLRRCVGLHGSSAPAPAAEAAVKSTAGGAASADGATPQRPSSRTSFFARFATSIRQAITSPASYMPQHHAQQQEEWEVKEEESQPEGPAQAGEVGSDRPTASTAWDRGLADIWREFTHRLEGKRYSDVTLSKEDHASARDHVVSCALNDSEWRAGHLERVRVKQHLAVLPQLDKCRSGKRAGRLYVTDGSMPDYAAQGYPEDAPGMPCGVDSRANAILPHAVRSCRPTNLLHTLKTESTGTKTFTLFAPAGGGTNLTAFHLETKRRRSYNLGTGDFIIQPLATQDVIRKLMRVHAVVAGRHTRHGQLLPLEVYLEEGIPLVLHVRDYPFATLCELCEQSMHAFVSFGTVACDPPCLKVSCNDCDLMWEVDSCYWLEKLATAYKAQGLFPEEAVPPDGADTWVMSPYLLREPHTLAQKEAGWERPWLCEAKGADPAGGAEELENEDLHWSADVMAVRCVEKMLDVLGGALREAAAWAGELPSQREAAAVLRRARPVLADMRKRAITEGSSNRSPGGGFEPDWPLECHFSQEYLDDLLEQVSAAVGKHWPAEEAAGRAVNSAGPAGAAAAASVEAGGRAPPAKRQRRALAQQGAERLGAQQQQSGSGLPACLASPHVHASYAAMAGGSRALELVQLADAMLAAAVADTQPSTGAAECDAGASTGGDAGSGDGLPSLAGLPPVVLRSHWLLRLQLEWEAAAAPVLNLQLLALRRRQRSKAEALLDLACQRLAARHRADWGVLA